MSGPQQHDGQEHPKVENLEDLGLGKRQDEDASELCQRDSTEHLRKHITRGRQHVDAKRPDGHERSGGNKMEDGAILQVLRS